MLKKSEFPLEILVQTAEPQQSSQTPLRWEDLDLSVEGEARARLPTPPAWTWDQPGNDDGPGPDEYNGTSVKEDDTQPHQHNHQTQQESTLDTSNQADHSQSPSVSPGPKFVSSGTTKGAETQAKEAVHESDRDEQNSCDNGGKDSEVLGGPDGVDASADGKEKKPQAKTPPGPPSRRPQTHGSALESPPAPTAAAAPAANRSAMMPTRPGPKAPPPGVVRGAGAGPATPHSSSEIMNGGYPVDSSGTCVSQSVEEKEPVYQEAASPSTKSKLKSKEEAGPVRAGDASPPQPPHAQQQSSDEPACPDDQANPDPSPSGSAWPKFGSRDAVQGATNVPETPRGWDDSKMADDVGQPLSQNGFAKAMSETKSDSKSQEQAERSPQHSKDFETMNFNFEEDGEFAREIVRVKWQMEGQLAEMNKLKDVFTKFFKAYSKANKDSCTEQEKMNCELQKIKTERASERTVLEQVQNENEEMRQQLAAQKAEMDNVARQHAEDNEKLRQQVEILGQQVAGQKADKDEAARRHAEELSSGLMQLKDELLSSMKEQIDGQNLKRKQLKAYWEAELTTRCGSVKDSLSADLDKRANFLQENYRQEIRDSAQRVVTQQAQDQRTNEATFKQFNEVLQGLQQHDYQQNSSLQTLQNRAQALETSLKSLDQDMNSIDAKHGKLHQDRVAAEGQIRAEQLVQRQVAEATKAALETMKRETSSLVDKHKKEREDYASLEGKIDQKVRGLEGKVGQEFNNVKRSFGQELDNRDQSIQAIQVALDARKQETASLNEKHRKVLEELTSMDGRFGQAVQGLRDKATQDLETIKGKLDRRDLRIQEQKETLDAFTELANSMLEEQGKSINALCEQAKDLSWKCDDLDAGQKQQWVQTQAKIRSTEDLIVNQELPRIANQLEGDIYVLSQEMNTLRTSTTETLEGTKAELTSNMEKAVQDEQQRFTKLREKVSKSQEDLKNFVEQSQSEQLRREKDFTSSVQSWQTERERIQAEELKTMKAQIKEDTESMRQENRNFQHKIWRENEASNKTLKEQFEQEQTRLRTSDELSKQELLDMKQSVKDATAAMTQSVEDTNKAMRKSIEDMNQEMKESFEELQEEAYQTVQGRLEEVEQGIKEKEKELDIRGARLEEAFEEKRHLYRWQDRTEKTEQQLNQSLQELEKRFATLEGKNRASNSSGHQPQQAQPQDPILDDVEALRRDLREQQDEMDTFHMRLQDTFTPTAAASAAAAAAAQHHQQRKPQDPDCQLQQ